MDGTGLDCLYAIFTREILFAKGHLCVDPPFMWIDGFNAKPPVNIDQL